MSIENSRPIAYDWKEFILNDGTTDYDVSANQSALFSNLNLAKNVVLFHDKEIGLKWNSTLMPKITLKISMSPFQSPSRFLDVSNIYLSNSSGAAATIKILMW